MKRTIKLKLLKEFSDGKVEVEDLEGLRWIVGREAYERFKVTGFLHVAKLLAKEFQYILNGRNFGEISDSEKYKIIVKIIEAATKEPIDISFPNLAQIKGS